MPFLWTNLHNGLRGTSVLTPKRLPVTNCPSKSKREQVVERHVNVYEKQSVHIWRKLKSDNISRYLNSKQFNNMTSLIGIGRDESSFCDGQILTVVEI
jgi:hypothetical protein